MTIEYSIDEQDFLTFQLFTASKSETIRKRRFRAKFFPVMMYIALGALMYVYGKPDLTIIFGLLTIIWFFMYPLREKRQYRVSYEKFIRDNFKDKLGQQASLIFHNQYLINKDQISESKVQYNQLEQITEIPELILIKLREGQTFILPKNKVGNLEEAKLYLKELAGRLNIPYSNEYGWVWK